MCYTKNYAQVLTNEDDLINSSAMIDYKVRELIWENEKYYQHIYIFFYLKNNKWKKKTEKLKNLLFKTKHA